jgi:hypothetical protein
VNFKEGKLPAFQIGGQIILGHAQRRRSTKQKKSANALSPYETAFHSVIRQTLKKKFYDQIRPKFSE